MRNNTSPQQNATLKIPKLRQGLTVQAGDYDLEGKPQWLIHDKGRNKFFVIGWSEYELLKRWELNEVEAIINAVNTETTLTVGIDDLEQLIHFLSVNFLVQQNARQIYLLAKQQQLLKNENIWYWLIHHYLFFRIPLFHPDKFLNATKRIGDVLFHRYTFYFMSVLAIIALYQLSTQWDLFVHTFSSIFSWRGLVFYFIAFTFCKMCHELGHAYMCKRYGISVPTMGVAMLVFWPVLYTDTTLSWSLNSTQRLRIAVAGMWVETYVTIFALLIWSNFHNTTLQAICYLTITVNWLGSLLINMSPFMRFDGYYVLADLLKMPNLQQRAFALTRWQIRRWLFDWQDPPPEKFTPKLHQFLVIYSLVTWVYRLIIYFGIAVLVYHFFIKILGIILFVIELYYFILRPVVLECYNWYLSKDKFSLNLRTKLTLIVCFVATTLFFMPFEQTIELPATLSYAHQFLYAPIDGVLATPIPQADTYVKTNQTIMRLSSPLLDYQLQATALEYQKLLSELRRAAINSKYSHQQSILNSSLTKVLAEHQKLLALSEKLNIKVPFNGVLVEVPSELQQGTVVMKDEWLGDIINPNLAQVEAFVSFNDLNNIHVGLQGYYYPENLVNPPVPVKVVTVEPLNASQIDCDRINAVKQDKEQSRVVATPCYNLSELGGLIETTVDEKGKHVPVESVYHVILLAEKLPSIAHIENGIITLDVPKESLAHRLLYKLKRVWMQEIAI